MRGGGERENRDRGREGMGGGEKALCIINYLDQVHNTFFSGSGAASHGRSPRTRLHLPTHQRQTCEGDVSTV